MPKAMNVGELVEILERIQEVYALAGAKGPAEDFKRLLGTLVGHEQETIDQFVEETRALLNPLVTGSTRKPKRPEANLQVVEEHVRRLLLAGASSSAFEAAMGKLKNDASVRTAELMEITNRYLNDPTGGTFEFDFKTDVAAYRAIKRMFVDRAQDDSKARVIKRMTG
jgi:hypothetical protein